MPNYCKDCAHFRVGLGSHPLCVRFEKVEKTESLVWGVREERHSTFCEMERKENGQCGPDGKGFSLIDFEALKKAPDRSPKRFQWFC